MSKTILHILNTNSYSGAENVAITIIRQFQKQNSDIRFVYVSLDGPIRNVLQSNQITFEPIKKVSRKEIKRVIKKYKPDVIHAHDFTASIISAVSTFKIPIISHIHNNSPWLKKVGKNSIVYGISCLRYKKILGVSPSVFDEYVFGKYFKKKELIIGNPIDLGVVRQAALNASKKQAYDIVFLGRLTEQKNPLLFVDIIQELSERLSIKVGMIGDGDLRSQVEETIQAYNLSETITLEGFVENPHGILNESKVLCLPSAWEGFGLVAVEALALGKPVVASPVGGIPTIIVGEEGKLCQSKMEFVDALGGLLTSKNTYNTARTAAFARAEEIENIKGYIQTLKGVYSEE